MSRPFIVFMTLLLFLVSSPVFAGNLNDGQCAARTLASKSVAIAALTDDFAESNRVAPGKNLLDTIEAAPRSEWIQVAPLVVRRCCGGYDCDQQSGTCVCRKWCD